MKQIRVTILIIATTLLLCACPKSEDNINPYITIINKSNTSIVWQPRMINIGEINEIFDCNYQIHEQITPNSQYMFLANDRKNDFENELKTHSLQITLMNFETFDKFKNEPCDTIRKYVPVLHTYRLTLTDLQRMNWTVVYPPEK